MVFTTVALHHFHIERGEGQLGRFASTPFGERGYCRDCGSPLTIHVRHQPGEIDIAAASLDDPDAVRSEEHTSELQSPMRNPYAVFCLKKKKHKHDITSRNTTP